RRSAAISACAGACLRRPRRCSWCRSSSSPSLCKTIFCAASPSARSSADTPMSTIELRRITKRFGSFVAVRNVDLALPAGEVLCLLGPSGCGKTTTLRVIAGLESASSGDVIIAGRRMNQLAPEKRDVAMVFQFYALYPALTVRQNLALPLYYERISADE